MPTVELKAPLGKFRIICVDSLTGNNWLAEDFDSIDEAIKYADESTKGETMIIMYVYDDAGKYLYDSGTF